MTKVMGRSSAGLGWPRLKRAQLGKEDGDTLGDDRGEVQCVTDLESLHIYGIDTISLLCHLFITAARALTHSGERIKTYQTSGRCWCLLRGHNRDTGWKE